MLIDMESLCYLWLIMVDRISSLDESTREQDRDVDVIYCWLAIVGDRLVILILCRVKEKQVTHTNTHQYCVVYIAHFPAINNRPR